jgi:hypothetical protein
MNGENTEIYYAEMEAARNEAEDAYFNARPQLEGTIHARSLFRAGFERGFRMAWERRDREKMRISDDRLRNAPERTGYERMFHSAVATLAEISDALGIPEDVASTANGNAEILHAIAELKARASHARDALREQRRERLRDAPGGDDPDDDGPCPDRRCTGF